MIELRSFYDIMCVYIPVTVVATTEHDDNVRIRSRHANEFEVCVVRPHFESCLKVP